MRKAVDGKLTGTIACRWCGVMFCAHISVRYCCDEHKKLHLKSFGKCPKRESSASKRIRRAIYRENAVNQGLCKHCGKTAIKGRVLCEYHLKKHAQYDRVRKAKRNYGELWQDQITLLTIKDQIKEIENYAKRTQYLIGKEIEGCAVGNYRSA